jgi:hypothetical protein
MKKGLILIAFAWAVEIVGVSAGLVNSVYTTFPKELPRESWEWLAAIPMVMLPLAELGRVPLASVLFHRHKVMQMVAISGILVLGYLAVENWTFGFERIVQLRMKTVSAAAMVLSQAEAKEKDLVKQRENAIKGDDGKRKELRDGTAQRNAELKDAAATHKTNLDAIKEACRLVPDKCMLPRSRAEDQRYQVEVGRITKERDDLQHQIDSVVSKDRSGAETLEKQIAEASAKARVAKQDYEDEISQNQIYRLANSFGWTLERARMVFSTFSAVAVALTGSVAALVYYARERVPGEPWLGGKLMRARRAYYARKRRTIYRDVPVEKIIYRDGKEPPMVVEKEVIRWIDRIVLIPRWGVRQPTPIKYDENITALKRVN